MSAVTTLSNNPDTLWKILPRSATRLERDLLKTTSSDEFRRAMGLIPRVKRELEPTDWIPFLLIEYGAAEAAKLFKDWRKLLDYIKMIRGKQGTPFAVEEMAKLMRYAQNQIWEEPEPTVHFPEFQLELGEYEPSLARISTLRKLINTVKPARGRFRRVFHGWDERQMVWDDTEFGCFWDAESGVDILPLGVYGDYRGDDQFIVSLGQFFLRQVTLPAIAINDSSDPQRGYPLVLVERHFMSQSMSDFYPTLDTEGWDGDIIDDPGTRLKTIIAPAELAESEFVTLWEQGYPTQLTNTVVPPLLDDEGWDGDVEGGTVEKHVDETAGDDLELETPSHILEHMFSTESVGAGEGETLDTDELDGGSGVESPFTLEEEP